MQSVSACPMNETGAHTQPDKPGRMIVATRLNKFRRIGNNHTSFVVVCPFHASGDVFFLLVILFFTDFPLKFFSTQSASVFVYLHFAPFSEMGICGDGNRCGSGLHKCGDTSCML